jgi:hypothetical protein
MQSLHALTPAGRGCGVLEPEERAEIA